MRERISEPMSDYYKNEVELPLLLDDYDHRTLLKPKKSISLVKNI